MPQDPGDGVVVNAGAVLPETTAPQVSGMASVHRSLDGGCAANSPGRAEGRGGS